MKRATAWTDGGNRGNPGHHACAVVLKVDGGATRGESRYLGPAGTNNDAEYQGLIMALELATEESVSHLTIRSDSMLIVEQLLGNWRVKEPTLKPLHRRACELAGNFESVHIDHIRREFNREADAICTRVLDSVTGRARKS